MKVHVDQTVPAILNWAVALASKRIDDPTDATIPPARHCRDADGLQWEVPFDPCNDWGQAGPLIDGDAYIELTRDIAWWQASRGAVRQCGNTMLEAAMRCYVASKLGEEFEVPDELLTMEVCLEAIKQDERFMSSVPEHLLEAVKAELGGSYAPGANA